MAGMALEIGRMEPGFVKKREETFNGFIRRNCPLRRLEKLPAQKMRDLYGKIQTGSNQTVKIFCSDSPTYQNRIFSEEVTFFTE